MQFRWARGACTAIKSRSGDGSSATPWKWNDVCARDSNRPTTVGGWMRPTSGLRASGCIYTGLSTPPVRRSTSFCRLSATQLRLNVFSPRPWAERTIRRRGSSTPTSTPVIHRPSCGSKPRRLWRRIAGIDRCSTLIMFWNRITGPSNGVRALGGDGAFHQQDEESERAPERGKDDVRVEIGKRRGLLLAQLFEGLQRHSLGGNGIAGELEKAGLGLVEKGVHGRIEPVEV